VYGHEAVESFDAKALMMLEFKYRRSGKNAHRDIADESQPDRIVDQIPRSASDKAALSSRGAGCQ